MLKIGYCIEHLFNQIAKVPEIAREALKNVCRLGQCARLHAILQFFYKQRHCIEWRPQSMCDECPLRAVHRYASLH